MKRKTSTLSGIPREYLGHRHDKSTRIDRI